MKRKKMFAALAAFFTALCLCACGGEAPGECGVYTLAAVRAEGESVSLSSVCPDGAELALLAGGKGRVTVGAESGSLKWRLDGTELYISTDSGRYAGSLKDGAITLSFSKGVELCFLKEGAVIGEDWFTPGQASPLCGGWYGWWRISGAAEHSEFSDSWFDCCGRIEALSGGVGRLVIWDEDGSSAEPMAVVSLRFEGDAAHSVEGFFWNRQLSDGEWRLDTAGAEFENMLYFTGAYGDEFEYTFCLRPWGSDWDDVRSARPELLPFFYESWYKPLADSGEDMPDKILSEREG